MEYSSLKVISLLTNDLALHVAGTGSADTSNQSQPAATARSRLFYRIYAYLIKVLERHASGVDDGDAPFTKAGRPSTPDVRPGFPSGNRSAHVEDTAGIAITAISNLLSSNVDVGLKHCLAMGYHAKPEIRSAFMQVMIRALRNGAPIAGSGSSGGAASSKRQSVLGRPFIDALNVGNMALAVACVEVCPVGPEVDDMSTLLFRVMEAKGLLLPFLRVLIEREVHMTSEQFRALLIRSN